MRFFAPPALSIWRHDALFDPSNARRSRASTRTRRPRRRTRLTSDAPSPSSRKRRCAPTARGGYPRVRGGPHLAGACPDASRQQYPRKPRTNCLCRDFPQTSRASSRRVTLRHTARPPSRSIPLTRDFPRIHPTTRPTGLRAPSSVSRRNRARAVAVRATYTGASRARSRSSFRRSRRFFRYAVFGDCHPYARAPDISDFFPESNERTVVFFVVSFFPRKNHPSIFDVATDGEARPRVTNDMSALTVFTRCLCFVCHERRRPDNLTT